MEQEHRVEVAPSSTGMSRRVIVKSAAWSLPVFATVGVTPAFAASASASIAAGTLTVSRGAGNPARATLTFTWTTSTSAVNATITAISVSASGTGSTFGAATVGGTTGNPTVTFTSPTSSHTNNPVDITDFTISATLTYTVPGNSKPQTARQNFSVQGLTGIAPGSIDVPLDIDPQ